MVILQMCLTLTLRSQGVTKDLCVCVCVQWLPPVELFALQQSASFRGAWLVLFSLFYGFPSLWVSLSRSGVVYFPCRLTKMCLLHVVYLTDHNGTCN